jgi:ectoine hydroxylase-related dioxygenase (phytanoyl-CoA dioxygenase family)
MEVGEASFMLASTFHGGSTNYSKSENRLLFTIFVCKGMLRQELATLVEYPPEMVKGWNKEITARLEYKIRSPNCRMMDMRDPGFYSRMTLTMKHRMWMLIWTKGGQGR